MKESCVGAFARAARWLALAAVALIVGAGTLHAQATGKLEGRIRDQAGAPVPGAQVTIEGTAFGAVANNQGYYFINNVPAGSVDLKATFVGYKPVRVVGLRIVAGQTITQDFQLEQSPVELEEITQIAAVNALVPRDAVTTKQNISGEYTEKLPVDRIANVLALQPGVVAQNNGGITIRGGRPDEAAVYVDGVPVTAGNRGGQFVGTSSGRVDVSTGGFEQASVTTGGTSAEFGNAQSGVIAIETKSGGSSWNGSFGYENDEIGGMNHSLGYNRVQANVGGPIMNNLSLHVGGDIEGQKSAGQGLDGQKFPVFVPVGVDTTVAVLTNSNLDTTFVDVSKFAMYTGECDAFKGSSNNGISNNYGYDCQGARLPGTATSSYRVNGKLQYTFGAGNRVALTALRTQGNTRNFNYGAVTAPENMTGGWTANNVLTLNWTQNLSKSTERALALEMYGSYQWDRAITGPLTRSGEQDTRDPFGGFIVKPLDFLFDFDNFPTEDIYKNFQTNSGTLSPYDIKNNTQYQAVNEYRNNPYGVNETFSGFVDRGGPTGRISLYKESRAIGKANLDWQVDRYNRMKIGGEYTKYHMVSYSSALTSQAFSDAYNEKPVRWNAFIEDRLDLGDVVLVGGLRYDYYKSGAERPYYTDSLGNRSWFPRISTMPGYDVATFDTLLVADKSHDYLSPHIQVSFPVSDRTNMRFSYAHQVQPPDFALVLGGINTDLSVTNTNHVYGSDLDFGKTITFEFGIRHAFSDDFVLDFSAYNRDAQSNQAGRLLSLYDPLKLQNQDIRMMTNQDYGNYRGFDIRLDKRIGSLFNGTLAYSFSDAKNTGSDPFTYINFGSRIVNQISGGNDPPPSAYLPTTYTRPHNLAGSFSVTFPNQWNAGSTTGAILQNVGIFATFRVASGTAYTRCPVETGNESVLSTQVCARQFEGDVNGSRLPTFRNADLRVTKGFRFGGVDLTAYLDARNVFNFTNTTTVFAENNSIENAVELQETWSGDSAGYADEAIASNSYDIENGDMFLPTPGACGNWVTQDGNAAAPNCVYLVRAEERFGNGDGVFTQSEQRRASEAFYYSGRSEANFTAAPRRLRLGLELNF